jgi:hypothetical protein
VVELESNQVELPDLQGQQAVPAAVVVAKTEVLVLVEAVIVLQ